MLRRPALLSPVLLLGACATPQLEAMARYGEYGVDGDLTLSSTGVTAGNDLDTLGLDADEGTFGAVAEFKWGMPHLTVSSQRTSYSGDGRLESELSLGGKTISAGADVSSDLDFGVTNAILTFDVLPGPVELGIGFGATLLEFSSSFEEKGTGEKVSTDATLPAPVLAARVGFELGAVEVSGLLSGLSVDAGDGRADVLDADVFARWKFLGGSDHFGASLVVGYRDVKIDADYDDGDDNVELDFTYSGPYVGLQFRF